MKYQNLLSFEKHLEASTPHHFARAYLIVVGDDQERSSILQSIASRLLSREGSLEKFSSESEMKEVFDALQSPSLFGKDPVVVLDGCEAFKKKEVDLLLSFLDQGEIFGYLLLGAKSKVSSLSKGIENLGIVLDTTDEKPWEKEKRLAQFLVKKAKDAGKWLSEDAANLLLERLGHDVASLSQELDKLICYVGDRPSIDRSDIFRISSCHPSSTLWEMAESIVWEGKKEWDEAAFPGILFALRSQLQIGLKIASLLKEKVPFQEWGSYFPKVWPRTLEKRKEEVMKRGDLFFRRGLDLLFKIESLSRSGSHQTGAFLDLFYLGMYGKR